MKVSVITATTGGVRLADCIESVRNQTYKNIEHYVIVDGSAFLLPT
jgi:glycosyltransferase involved in cell wall biosynthesis